MPRCYIGFGGNLGDVERTFDAATSGFARTPGVAVVRISPVFKTHPVGRDSGGEFQNAAVALDTSLDPLSLLDVMHDLERRAGRNRVTHWGPRPLDLDLIFYSDQIIDDPRLTVPHPSCWYRRFVLDPLSTIAPDVRHPVKGVTVAELRTRLLRRPFRLAIAGSRPADRQRLIETLRDSSTDVEIFDWTKADDRTGAEPEIVAWLGRAADESGRDAFDRLPAVPRLDVSAVDDKATFLRDVLAAALG